MPSIVNHTGCRVVVREAQHERTLCEGLCIGFDMHTNLLTLNKELSPNSSLGELLLLLIHSDRMYEYCGRLRSSYISGTAQIALYNGRHKESRNQKRYMVNAPATIENLLSANTLVPLSRPIVVRVANLSSNGALIVAPPNSLYIGSHFQLKITIGGAETILDVRVVRVRHVNPEASEYGCVLMAQAVKSQ